MKTDTPATRKDIDEVLKQMQIFMHQVDERFNKMEKDVVSIKTSLDKLTNTIDAFVKRLDSLETENLARDRQFDRLLEWARKVSKKTGIPLENL